jgi:hypothetical protein
MKYLYEEDFYFRLPYRLVGSQSSYKPFSSVEGLRWCEENFTDHTLWSHRGGEDTSHGLRISIWSFKNKDDVIRFKLIFGGC